MDKLAKVRAEVARIQLYTQSETLKQILSFIDSLEEEPTGNPLGSTHAEFKTAVESLGISQEEYDRIVDECIYGKEPELVDADDLPKEEPVNNDFEMALAEMIGNAQTSVVEPLVIAAQWKDELIKLAKSEELVSEDLEEAMQHNAPDNIGIDDLLYWRNGFIAGAEWQKTKDESTTEDLGDYINKLSKQFQEVSFAKLSRIAVRVAKWQKEQFEKNRLEHCNSITNEQAELEQGFIDQHLDKYQRMPTYLDAIEYGMKLKEQQMVANTADAMIGLPYENKDGGYTHLIDVSRPLPVGNNKIAIIFKED